MLNFSDRCILLNHMYNYYNVMLDDSTYPAEYIEEYMLLMNKLAEELREEYTDAK